MAPAARDPLISARTPPDKKARFAALATSLGVTESALLVRLVDAVLEHNPVPPATAATDEPASSERISLRLRPGDGRLVAARAAARRMRPASYLVALVRAHVRRQPPMPVAELDELRRAVAHLSAVGRNLNQVARAANEGQGVDREVLGVLHTTPRSGSRRCAAASPTWCVPSS